MARRKQDIPEGIPVTYTDEEWGKLMNPPQEATDEED